MNNLDKMLQLLRWNHQDTVFSSLYSDPECVLDLYFTLHPEDRKGGMKKLSAEEVTKMANYEFNLDVLSRTSQKHLSQNLLHTSVPIGRRNISRNLLQIWVGIFHGITHLTAL